MKKSKLQQLIKEIITKVQIQKMNYKEFENYARKQYQKHQKQNLHPEDRMDYGEFYDELKAIYNKF